MAHRLFALVLPGVASWGGPRPDRMVAGIGHALPEADWPALRSMPDAERGRHQGAPAGLRDARREVDAAMIRKPFDVAARRGAMTAWSGRGTAFGGAFTKVHAMAAGRREG
ncbi:hypothetical protein GCM10009416_00150 [Craurococcus roseus]|uniref:Transposase n=1 Tax=Craurococcus roseus TaxID=77585 RepID=A0ABP3PLZ1_9PROT